MHMRAAKVHFSKTAGMHVKREPCEARRLWPSILSVCDSSSNGMLVKTARRGSLRRVHVRICLAAHKDIVCTINLGHCLTWWNFGHYHTLSCLTLRTHVSNTMRSEDVVLEHVADEFGIGLSRTTPGHAGKERGGVGFYCSKASLANDRF
jgi:hypothetical protein